MKRFIITLMLIVVCIAVPIMASEMALETTAEMIVPAEVAETTPEEKISSEDNEVTFWIPDVVAEYAAQYGTIMIVDTINQHAYCCVGGNVIADTDCVTGDLYNSPTPTGLYSVWYKRSDFYMMDIYYSAYATFFNGGIAIHDADAWRSEYGGTIYQGSGSHGCVNTPRWFAELVYYNTDYGTPVYVF